MSKSSRSEPSFFGNKEKDSQDPMKDILAAYAKPSKNITLLQGILTEISKQVEDTGNNIQIEKMVTPNAKTGQVPCPSFNQFISENKMLKDKLNSIGNQITRAKLTDYVIRVWFQSQLTSLIVDGYPFTGSDSESPKGCIELSKALALKMFESKAEVTLNPSDAEIAKLLVDNKLLAIILPLQLKNGQLEFIHPSLNDYFYTRKVYDERHAPPAPQG